jgi:hypothetical protein
VNSTSGFFYVVLMPQIILLLLGAVPLTLVARVGRGRLKAIELATLVVVTVVGCMVVGVVFRLAPLVILTIQLALGLAWIRVRKGYLINKTPSAVPRAADVPTVTRDTSAASIFISYRRGSSNDVTGRMYDRLVRQFGKERVFKDVDSIPLGVDFRKHLTDSVGKCQLLLAVIGTDWRGGEPGKNPRLDEPHDFVRIEIESALQRGIPVIPVLVQGAPVPQEEELPPSLQALAFHQTISVRPDPDFHSDVERLIKGIEHHLSAEAHRSKAGSTLGAAR